MRGPGHAGPGRGLLGDRHDAGDAPVGGGVRLLQERDRLEVLAAAVDVRDPLAVVARVVQVEHRGDGVDPQAVDVELLEPVQRVGDQEVADLVPAEVEDEGAPVRVLAAPRVAVLVERLAVEPGQRPLVLREVRGHPVEDHADAGLVQAVDEVPEVVGRPEARRRRVVGADLVAPGAAERVLGHRQELDVGEAEVADVAGQLVGEIPVATGPAATTRGGPRRRSSDCCARRSPRGERSQSSSPQVVGGLGDDARGRRRDLGARRPSGRPSAASAPSVPWISYL